MTTLPMPDPPKEYDHPSGWPPIEHPKDLQHGRTFAFKHVGAKIIQNKKKSQRCNMQRKWTWCSVFIFILLDYLWNISTCPTFESRTIPESISCITSGSSSNMWGCVAFCFLLPNFSGFVGFCSTQHLNFLYPIPDTDKLKDVDIDTDDPQTPSSNSFSKCPRLRCKSLGDDNWGALVEMQVIFAKYRGLSNKGPAPHSVYLVPFGFIHIGIMHSKMYNWRYN